MSLPTTFVICIQMEKLNKVIAPGKMYPEKVIQFGTGVLLRGLPDYFIEKANRQSLFKGSILVVKSTLSGGLDAFREQDNRYTIHINGLERGQPVAETLVVSAISRVVSAQEGWSEVLAAATNPDMKVVISNTTEVGIVLDETDQVAAEPPRSFPGKLTSLLYKRYQFFNGDRSKGLVILPTELIDRNGEQLRDIVIRLAQLNNLPLAFITWLQAANAFCNTLVDRIVPGKLPENSQREAEAKLGYRDELAIMAEPFRLWAIEVSDQRVKDVLSFAEADAGVVLTPDITKFKEMKLRLLNGSHTFSCALAMLGGWQTVKAAMEDESFSMFVRDLMYQEIIPSLGGVGIDTTEAHEFADAVIDRFGNPFLDHRWESISLNYTAKMEMRNVATIARCAAVTSAVDHQALGFAAYLLLLREHELNDPFSAVIRQAWKLNDPLLVVDAVLRQRSLWKVDLQQYERFSDAVWKWLKQLLDVGVQATLKMITRK